MIKMGATARFVRGGHGGDSQAFACAEGDGMTRERRACATTLNEQTVERIGFHRAAVRQTP